MNLLKKTEQESEILQNLQEELKQVHGKEPKRRHIIGMEVFKVNEGLKSKPIAFLSQNMQEFERAIKQLEEEASQAYGRIGNIQQEVAKQQDLAIEKLSKMNISSNVHVNNIKNQLLEAKKKLEGMEGTNWVRVKKAVKRSLERALNEFNNLSTLNITLEQEALRGEFIALLEQSRQLLDKIEGNIKDLKELENGIDECNEKVEQLKQGQAQQ